MDNAKENERIQALATVLADLESERAGLDAAIAVIRRKMGSAAPAESTPAAAPAEPATRVFFSELELPSDAFFGMSIREAARKYLSVAKGKRPTKDMCAALLRGGFQTTAQNFAATLYSALSRQDDVFVRVGGDWGLVEWYPGRGRDRKARVANGKDQGADEDAEGERD